MTNLPSTIKDLPLENKRDLLAELLLKHAVRFEDSTDISYIEQSLWFMYQLAPESAAYNVVFAAEVLSELDIPAFKRAFQALVDRHAIFRTTYMSPNGTPIRRISANADVCFLEVDSSPWSYDQLQARLIEEAHRPFCLERDSPLRVLLFTRSSQQSILLLVVHHIAIDFWSLVIFLDELGQFYSQIRTGTEVHMPDLDLEYVDYVRWQRNLLDGPRGLRLWDYWKNQLAGDLPALDLSADHPRPLSQTFDGISEAFSLDEDLTARLRSLARIQGVTPNTVLLAAYFVMLHRYTGQDDILVGSPMSGREHALFGNIIGSFTNVVVLRASLASNLPFRSFVKVVYKTILDGIEHQDFPIALLIERLQPERDPGRPPLFQAAFTFNRPHRKELSGLVLEETGVKLEIGGLTLKSLALTHRIAMFDVLLLVYDIGGKFIASLQANTDLFDAATIRRMVGHYRRLLEGIVENPEQRISDLPLLTEGEKHQLLVQWNDTKTEFPRDLCVHQMFEAQVERTPEAIAVVFEDQQLTYDELNQRANQVAHYLRRLGVGPEVLVGICVERSLEMVVGILGILKAGGAYVPLDPTYPHERLDYMLQDTHTPVLLTQERLLAMMSDHKAQQVCLDRDWAIIAEEPVDNPDNIALASNLAYVIYTSGSTGTPKGVMNTHRSLVNLCCSLRIFFDDPSVMNTSLVTSISFDISVNQIFPTLINGKSLHVIPERTKLDPSAFFDYVIEQRLNLLDCVPSYLASLLSFGLRTSASLPIQYILVGGEKLEAHVVSSVFDSLSSEIEIVNIYGLTETCDISLFSRITAGAWTTRGLVGKPINNTTVYILDNSYGLIPMGITGEICIAGDGVSRGYLNLPGMTAERFVCNPFGHGEVICRTGDLGKWLSDGNIELVGRVDNQIKIRGYRIEAEEIEMVLIRHPDVRQAIVLVQADKSRGNRLVAYITQGTSKSASVADLRRYLLEKLPRYAVPSVFVKLDAMPLSPNGKIDREALPLPTDLAVESRYAPARNAVEEQVLAILSEVLGASDLGIHDDFFEVGGHSLLAIQLISRLRDTFEVELPLQFVFDNPTAAEIAEDIEIMNWLGQASQDRGHIDLLGQEEGEI